MIDSDASARLRLSKLHATGNDFLVLLDLEGEWGPRGSELLDPWTRAALCDRSTGIGADGLIRVLRSGALGADVAMELSNADGGWAEMSGNGIRCLAAAPEVAPLLAGDALRVDTVAGVRTVAVGRDRTGEVTSARVDMGKATFVPKEIPFTGGDAEKVEVVVGGVRYEGGAAGMGNPHLVLFVDDPSDVPIEAHGPALEHDPRFPARTNVELVAADGDELVMRVWERGIGETRSCGTGACAAAAVAHRRGLVGAHVSVHVPGGRLDVELTGGGPIVLGGPVAHVYDVDVDLGRIRRSALRSSPR